VRLLAQRRQDYGRIRTRSFPGGNGSDLRRSSGTRLNCCAEQTGVMRMGGAGTVVVIRNVKMCGKSEQPADDAEHRKRDDSFLDSMCEMHSG
jgi:hypothetical protein